MRTLRVLTVLVTLVALGLGLAAVVAAAEQCSQRGQLDPLYCDENGDGIADVPSEW